MGKKCPLKTVALAVDEKEKAIESSRGRAQSWWRPSRVWEARVECRWHGKVAWKSNEDTTPTKWKTSTNEDTWTTTTTTTKWRSTINITKNPPEVLPSKHHRWGFLAWLCMIICDYWWLLMIICNYKNDYLWLFVIINNYL